MKNSATILPPRRWAVAQPARQAKRIFSQGLRLLPIAILLAGLVATVAPVPEAHAATFDVNDTGDVGDANHGDGVCDDGSGKCTLRAAIDEANALAGPDTINLTLPGPYHLTAGELTVSSEISLNGNGEIVSAGGSARVFNVTGIFHPDGAGNLSLNGVTIRDGNADSGGGILIDWGGTLSVFNSSILNNVSDTNGGGVHSFFGTLNIVNSTISGNRAKDGGGVSHFQFGPATASLSHVTITNNQGDTRGGGISAFGLINVKNTIVAGNSTGGSGPDCSDDPQFGPFILTEGYNFIGDNSGCDGAFPSGTPNANNDLVGTSGSPLDPLLGDLADNGGPTETHALSPGSQAIDHIPQGINGCGTDVNADQRGVARPQGAGCDIGAFEFDATAQNLPPTADAGGPYAGDEGSAFALDGASASDPDDDPLTYAWSVDSALCGFSDPTVLQPILTCSDNGNFTATLTVDDGVNEPVSRATEVAVDNVAPEVGAISGPTDPVDMGDMPLSASASFSDPGTADTHTAAWDWDDGSVDTIDPATSPTSASHSYTAPGAYTIQLTVTDDDGGSDVSVLQLVVYDPDGGFVTGGGWIDSPEGAYAADLSLAAKANFGFGAKYKKGATVPTGQTEFQFADLNFHSDTYDWLVLAGPKAQLKGTGTIDGAGNYGFMLTIVDAELAPGTDVDLFRIKIWDREKGDALVYDSQMGDANSADPMIALGGGNVKLHP
jgi:PKD repeat protein